MSLERSKSLYSDHEAAGEDLSLNIERERAMDERRTLYRDYAVWYAAYLKDPTHYQSHHGDFGASAGFEWLQSHSISSEAVVEMGEKEAQMLGELIDFQAGLAAQSTTVLEKDRESLQDDLFSFEDKHNELEQAQPQRFERNAMGIISDEKGERLVDVCRTLEAVEYDIHVQLLKGKIDALEDELKKRGA